jgi:hypothetical protein
MKTKASKLNIRVTVNQVIHPIMRPRRDRIIQTVITVTGLKRRDRVWEPGWGKHVLGA